MELVLRFLASMALALPLLANAQILGAPDAPPMASATGTVVEVDRLRFRVTLEHGAIPSAKLPAGVDTFPVQNPSDVANLRPGDRVAFQLERQGDVWTVNGFVPITD